MPIPNVSRTFGFRSSETDDCQSSNDANLAPWLHTAITRPPKWGDLEKEMAWQDVLIETRLLFKTQSAALAASVQRRKKQ